MDIAKLIKIAENRVKKYDCGLLKTVGILPKNDNHHFPTITYPTWINNFPVDETKIFKKILQRDLHPFNIYIHIPFCTTLCTFCQFDTCRYTSSKEVDKYIDYIKKEIFLWKQKLNSSTLYPSSIFIGGGTPSLLNPAQWDRLLEIIHSNFNLKKCQQFSVDVEPRSLCGKKGLEKLKIMKNGGIHRICLGAQSFNDSILKKMQRPHNSKDIFEAIKLIKQTQFESLLLDLMFGFPEGSLDSWINDLQLTKKLNVDGYQAYQLRIINFRPKKFKKNILKENYNRSPNVFLSLNQIHLMKMLTSIISKQNGYKQYGRGVYLKNSKHNSKYLTFAYSKRYNCLGLGKGALTGINQIGLLNVAKNLDSYYNLIDKNLLPMTECHFSPKEEEIKSLFIMSMKNDGFVNKKFFKKTTGIEIKKFFGKKIENLKKYGLIKENLNTVSFTKKGLFFDDDILFHFYDPKEIPLPKSAYCEGPMNPFLKD